MSPVLCYSVRVTREEAQNRKAQLEARLHRLEDQLLETDASSASISSGSGSKSYSNRSVAELERKIRYCKREIAKLGDMLAGRGSGGIKTIYARFDA